MEKIFISWEQVHDAIEEFENRWQDGTKVYGIPKGGMIAAGFLKRLESVDSPLKADVFLDDIIDSGRTRKGYELLKPSTPFCVLFDKSEFRKGTWIVFPWELANPNGEETVEDNVVRLLQYIGEDPTRQGLVDTPRRVVKSYGQLFAGYTQDVDSLFTFFEHDEYDQMVVLKDIELYSVCEHHMLPFYGKAHVAYIPNGGKVVGISKLARLVDLYARRLQIQERIGDQVTAALEKHLMPKGAACVIEAAHMCMQMRGVGKQNSVMVTSSITGVFKKDLAVRTEFMNLIH